VVLYELLLQQLIKENDGIESRGRDLNFTAIDTNGDFDIQNYVGKKPLVIYFYPKIIHLDVHTSYVVLGISTKILKIWGPK
jgi:hypothetical protein